MWPNTVLFGRCPYYRLSHRRRIIRMLWHTPLALAVFGLLDWLQGTPLQEAAAGYGLFLAIVALEVSYNWFRWSRESR